jgi:hypothetical protein
VSTVQSGHTPVASYEVNNKNLRYRVSTLVTKKSERGALVDRGANGGILGADAHVWQKHRQKIDVTGIDNHEMTGLQMVDGTAFVKTQNGPVILIMRQYAYYGRQRTIHSSGQIEAYKNYVNDRSMKVTGGRQCIRTNDGYVIPIDIINGLPYIKMRPNTAKELKELPHVILTGGTPWNPTVLDNTISDKEDWYSNIKDLHDGLIKTPFDEYGNYRHREPTEAITDEEDDDDDESYAGSHSSEDTVLRADSISSEEQEELHESETQGVIEVFQAVCNLNQTYLFDDDPFQDFRVNKLESKKKEIDYRRFQPYFLNVPVEKVKRTFENTTQYATNVMAGDHIMQTIRSPYPALNVLRRNEPVATDTIYAGTPAIGTGGQKMAQLFVGRLSRVADVMGMHNEAQFINTLEDVIRKRGAMDKLISDSAQVEISKRVKDVLRAMIIDDWQSEANYQHQNFAEHVWKFIKRNVNWIMNWRNIPGEIWLLCMKWVIDVMNHTAEKSLGWRPPLQVLTGRTVDISILLVFMFWDVVKCSRYEDHDYKGQVGSKKQSEITGCFVGFSHDIGHKLTFLVLTDDTRSVIARSRVTLIKTEENNLKLDDDFGKLRNRVYVWSSHDGKEDSIKLPTIDTSFCPYKVEYDSDEDDEQSASDKVPKAVPHGRDMDSGTISPEKGENQSLSISAMKGEVHSAKETADAQGETDDEDDELPRLIPRGTPGYESGDESEDEEDVIDYKSPMLDPPLKENPLAPPADSEEYLAEHAREPPARGQPNPENRPRNFIGEFLGTPNPTQKDLAPEDAIGKSFLMPPEDDGTRHRARIMEIINDDRQHADERKKALIKFKCLVNDQWEEVVAYNQISDFINFGKIACRNERDSRTFLVVGAWRAE